ncbi:LamG domain-containing protein [Verrucomicrobiaceae bacterium 227]
MKTHKSLIIAAVSGLIAAATPHAQAVITWSAGAPGGSSGGSLDFDGASFLDTGAPSAGLSDYTISMWINGDSVSDKWFFGTGAQGLHLGVRSTPDSGPVNTLSQGHWGNDSDGTTTILANTWYHTTFTYDSATDMQTIYLNGVQESQTVKAGPNNTSTNLILGGRNGGGSWDGRVDDLAIWDSVISPADIASIAGGTAANTLGAQAYWDFEDNQAGMTAAQSGIGGLGAASLTGIVPEPSSLALLLLGSAGFFRRKRA